MKRKLKTKLDLIVPNTAGLVRQKEECQKQTHDHHAKQRDFEASDPELENNASLPPLHWLLQVLNLIWAFIC